MRRGGGQGERIPSVPLGDLADVLSIPQPSELVSKEGTEEFTITAHFLDASPMKHLDALGDIQLLVTTPRHAPLPTVALQDIEPGTRKKLRQRACLFFIHNGANPGADGNPFLQGDIAPLEEESKLLAIEPARLCETMIEIDERT